VLNGVNGVPRTLIPLAADTDMVYDITTRRPGGGAWSTADLAALEFRLRGASSLAPHGPWWVDNMTLVVQAQTAVLHNGHAVFQRTGVPDYDRHWLLMNTTGPASDEPVRLDLYNWTLNDGAGDWEAWNADVGGDGLVPAPGTPLMRLLQAEHHLSANGIVRVRFTFTDLDDLAGASSLRVDELVVKSALD